MQSNRLARRLADELRCRLANETGDPSRIEDPPPSRDDVDVELIREGRPHAS